MFPGEVSQGMCNTWKVPDSCCCEAPGKRGVIFFSAVTWAFRGIWGWPSGCLELICQNWCLEALPDRVLTCPVPNQSTFFWQAVITSAVTHVHLRTSKPLYQNNMPGETGTRNSWLNIPAGVLRRGWEQNTSIPTGVVQAKAWGNCLRVLSIATQ